MYLCDEISFRNANRIRPPLCFLWPFAPSIRLVILYPLPQGGNVIGESREKGNLFMDVEAPAGERKE